MTVYNKIVMGGRKMGRTQAQVNKFLTRINELEQTNRALVEACESIIEMCDEIGGLDPISGVLRETIKRVEEK